jgi:hypothetical protein
LPAPFRDTGGSTLLCTIVSGSLTSRSIAIAASPQRSIIAPIARERRSRPSPASAERRCQTTFAPLRCETMAAASNGESLRCTTGKRWVRISRSS